MKCDQCGKTMYPDQEWRLKPELTPGVKKDPAKVEGNEYVHKACVAKYRRQKIREDGDW